MTFDTFETLVKDTHLTHGQCLFCWSNLIILAGSQRFPKWVTGSTIIPYKPGTVISIAPILIHRYFGRSPRKGSQMNFQQWWAIHRSHCCVIFGGLFFGLPFPCLKGSMLVGGMSLLALKRNQQSSFFRGHRSLAKLVYIYICIYIEIHRGLIFRGFHKWGWLWVYPNSWMV